MLLLENKGIINIRNLIIAISICNGFISNTKAQKVENGRKAQFPNKEHEGIVQETRNKGIGIPEDNNSTMAQEDTDEDDEDTPLDADNPVSQISTPAEPKGAAEDDGRGIFPTDPKEAPKKKQGGQSHASPGAHFIETTNWSTESMNWRYRGNGWSRVYLPSERHALIPPMHVPGPALVVITNDVLDEVTVYREVRNLKDVSLHYRYFLSARAFLSPTLKVHQVQGSKKYTLETPANRGMWSHMTEQLPFSGDFKIVFEAMRRMLTNEIALDDITIRGILINEAKITGNATFNAYTTPLATYTTNTSESRNSGIYTATTNGSYTDTGEGTLTNLTTSATNVTSFGVGVTDDHSEVTGGSTWSVFRIFLLITGIGVVVLLFIYWRHRKRRDDEVPVFSRSSYTDYHNPAFSASDELPDDSLKGLATQGVGTNYKSFG